MYNRLKTIGKLVFKIINIIFIKKVETFFILNRIRNEY